MIHLCIAKCCLLHSSDSDHTTYIHVTSHANHVVVPFSGITWHTESVDIGGHQLQYETGRLARLANGSCVAKYQGTVVLSTAVLDATPVPTEESTPLQVSNIVVM